MGPLQRVLLLDTPRLTVWRRLLPAPRAAQSLRAVLAVQRRRRAHRHIHTVDRDQFWCNWLPVAMGLLVRWRERVRPAENRYTPLVWKQFTNVPFRKCALLYLQCWRMIYILMLFNICLSIISIITVFAATNHHFYVFTSSLTDDSQLYPLHSIAHSFLKKKKKKKRKMHFP